MADVSTAAAAAPATASAVRQEFSVRDLNRSLVARGLGDAENAALMGTTTRLMGYDDPTLLPGGPDA